MENATRYTSTATVSPFGRNQSGEYTCMANIELVTANPFIIGGTGMDKITVGIGKVVKIIFPWITIIYGIFLCLYVPLCMYRCPSLSKGSGL
jgi:hypothetical protein